MQSVGKSWGVVMDEESDKSLSTDAYSTDEEEDETVTDKVDATETDLRESPPDNSVKPVTEKTDSEGAKHSSKKVVPELSDCPKE